MEHEPVCIAGGRENKNQIPTVPAPEISKRGSSKGQVQSGCAFVLPVLVNPMSLCAHVMHQEQIKVDKKKVMASASGVDDTSDIPVTYIPKIPFA
eukprot:scaffold170612_cov19-Tisochrysis_lutea.AAC.2